MPFETTLHVNLLHTTLDDFARHFSEYVVFSIVDDDTGESAQFNLWKTFENDEISLSPATTSEAYAVWFTGPSFEEAELILVIVRGGETYGTWQLYENEQEAEEDGPDLNSARFWLRAAHYRRDMLTIVFVEDIDDKLHGGAALLTWLQQHWGDAVKVLDLEDAPAMPQSVGKGGRRFPTPRIKAHAAAIERLKAGENKVVNFNKWQEEYLAETGIDPGDKDSGANELYRGSVWRPFQNLGGNS